MRVANNDSASSTLRMLRRNFRAESLAREKLVTGHRINHAADDAAGLAVSEQMRMRELGLHRASRNSQDAITLVQVTDAAMQVTTDLVQRLRTLAVQAATDSLSDNERDLIQKEVDQLISEVDRVGSAAQYNGRKLLHGTSNGTLTSAGTWTSAGTPIDSLKNAIGNLKDGNQAITLSYSFMIAGTQTDVGTTTELADQVDGSVTRDMFKNDVRAAFKEWEDLFESTFNTGNGYGGNLTVEFEDLGDETGSSQESSIAASDYGLPHADNVGDFRIGMHGIDGSLVVLAHGFTPGGTPQTTGNVGSDVHFDSAEDWRRDESDPTDDSGALSVKLVAAHEIGHALAIGHDTNNSSVMLASVLSTDSFRTKFTDGLKGSTADQAALVGIYGVDAQATVRDNFSFQVGSERGQKIAIDIPTLNASRLGINALKVRTQQQAADAIASLDQALGIINNDRTQMGALQNKLERVTGLNGLTRDNLLSAISNIKDADFGESVTQASQDQILVQTATSALSQANLNAQSVLQLIR